MAEDNNKSKHIVIGQKLISMFNKAKGNIQLKKPNMTVTDEYVVYFLLNLYLEEEQNGRTTPRKKR